MQPPCYDCCAVNNDNILTYYNETKNTPAADRFDYKYRCSQCGVFCANVTNIDEIIDFANSEQKILELLNIFGINIKYTEKFILRKIYRNDHGDILPNNLYQKIKGTLTIEINQNNYSYEIFVKLFENNKIIIFIQNYKFYYLVYKHYSTLKNIPINFAKFPHIYGLSICGGDHLTTNSLRKTISEISKLSQLFINIQNTNIDFHDISNLHNLRELIIHGKTNLTYDDIKKLNLCAVDIDNMIFATPSNYAADMCMLQFTLKELIIRDYDNAIPHHLFSYNFPELKKLIIVAKNKTNILIDSAFIDILNNLFPNLKMINLHYNIEFNISVFNKLRLFMNDITINKISTHECRFND